VKALDDVFAEKVLPDPDHIVQKKNTVRFLEEEKFILRKRVDAVVGAQESEESLFEEGVHRVAERILVAFFTHNARAKIEVECARLQAKPIVVPAREQPEAVVRQSH
jgi:hypothetical protein